MRLYDLLVVSCDYVDSPAAPRRSQKRRTRVTRGRRAKRKLEKEPARKQSARYAFLLPVKRHLSCGATTEENSSPRRSIKCHCDRMCRVRLGVGVSTQTHAIFPNRLAHAIDSLLLPSWACSMQFVFVRPVKGRSSALSNAAARNFREVGQTFLKAVSRERLRASFTLRLHRPLGTSHLLCGNIARAEKEPGKRIEG